MKQNFEIELDDYLDDSEDIDSVVHFKNHRRRRSHDARRQIERMIDRKRLRRLIDHFDGLDS